MRKPAKRPSLGRRLLQLFFNSASALAIVAGNVIVRNPVLTGGATAFAVVMGFVSANALWYQPQAHDTVFFQTRSNFSFKALPRPTLPGTMAAGRSAESPAQSADTVAAILQDETPAPQAGQAAELSPDRLQLADVVDEMLPALAPNADLEVARLQQRLLALGIYKGEVDGFSGPQTRKAVERWQGLQAKLGVKQNGAAAPAANDAARPSALRQDDVAKTIEAAVPVPRPQPQPVSVRRQVPAPAAPAPAQQQAAIPSQDKISSQDIVRVQAGLKAFGNDRVSVDGVPGKSTQEAVREFQKLFGLPATGAIDTTLIGKMREIGLIS